MLLLQKKKNKLKNNAYSKRNLRLKELVRNNSFRRRNKKRKKSYLFNRRTKISRVKLKHNVKSSKSFKVSTKATIEKLKI